MACVEKQKGSGQRIGMDASLGKTSVNAFRRVLITQLRLFEREYNDFLW
jgi:hypothetical protein